MDYKLALLLKNAGFPQGGAGITCAPPGGKIGESEAYYPTLSELIEACGEEFSSLAKLEENIHEHKWGCIAKELFSGYGNTPIEAVANLWLALNNHG